MCPTGLPHIAAIRIERVGVTLWRDDKSARCSRFRPTGRQLETFFRNAVSVDRAAVHYTLPESPCVAQGAVTFADGSSGRWQVDSFDLGWLDRAGRTRMTLYCRSCRRVPWRQ